MDYEEYAIYWATKYILMLPILGKKQMSIYMHDIGWVESRNQKSVEYCIASYVTYISQAISFEDLAYWCVLRMKELVLPREGEVYM